MQKLHMVGVKVYQDVPQQDDYLKNFCKNYTREFTTISTTTVLESITDTNPECKEYQGKTSEKCIEFKQNFYPENDLLELFFVLRALFLYQIAQRKMDPNAHLTIIERMKQYAHCGGIWIAQRNLPSIIIMTQVFRRKKTTWIDGLDT